LTSNNVDFLKHIDPMEASKITQKQQQNAPTEPEI